MCVCVGFHYLGQAIRWQSGAACLDGWPGYHDNQPGDVADAPIIIACGSLGNGSSYSQ